MARGKKKKAPEVTKPNGSGAKPRPARSALTEPSIRPFAALASELKRVAVPAPAPVPGGAKGAKKDGAGARVRVPPSALPELSDEELLAQALRDVRPLDAQKRERVAPTRKTPPPSAPLYDEDADTLAKLAGMLDGSEPLGHEHGEEHTEWIADDVDRGLLARLVGGEFPAQAHVDLHGMTREQAHEAVIRFLADARIRRLRCVLIVHGRGNHSEGSIPVLKLAVQRWLGRGALKAWVFAFATARPVDGGPGAMYVMVRDAG